MDEPEERAQLILTEFVVNGVEENHKEHKGHKEQIKILCALCVFVVFFPLIRRYFPLNKGTYTIGQRNIIRAQSWEQASFVAHFFISTKSQEVL